MLGLMELYLGLGLIVGYRQPAVLFDGQIVLHVALAAAALLLWQLGRRHRPSLQ